MSRGNWKSQIRSYNNYIIINSGRGEIADGIIINAIFAQFLTLQNM